MTAKSRAKSEKIAGKNWGGGKADYYIQEKKEKITRRRGDTKTLRGCRKGFPNHSKRFCTGKKPHLTNKTHDERQKPARLKTKNPSTKADHSQGLSTGENPLIVTGKAGPKTWFCLDSGSPRSPKKK